MHRQKEVQQKILENIFHFREQESEHTERQTALEDEISHSIACSTLAKLTALRRNLDQELASIVGITHDYGRIITGRKEGHAQKAAKPLQKLLSDTALFSGEEISLITNAVKTHSSKGEVGGAYEELIKDVDVLENFLSGQMKEKPDHEKRLKKILEEINIPNP